jgi:tRNA(Ile)-lysidine synthase
MSFSAATLCAVLDAHVPTGATGLVVALSGGADSASLLAAASTPGAPFRGLPLRAVHIDHGLQSAAASFRAACAALCETLGVPLAIIPVAVPAPPGASLEAAARAARYEALRLELKSGECLLTAHHSTDQAETMLLQALRGSGLKGMSAMPICRPFGRGSHLRPVLEVPQHELLAFGAGLRGICVADPMNEDLRFERGYLRRRVWPMIKTRWPGVETALSRTARHAAEAQHLLTRAGAADVGRLRDGEALSVPGLRALSEGERTNAIRHWLCEAGIEPPPTARLIEALRQILSARLDHQPAMMWGDWALRRYRQRIFLTASCPPRLEGTRDWSIRPESRLVLAPELGELRWVAHTGGIDLKRLPETLTVRGRTGGEALKPGVAARTRTVQHLCQSLGVLPWMRGALPLVYAHDALVAVADLWVDARWCAASGAPGFAVDWHQGPIIV